MLRLEKILAIFFWKKKSAKIFPENSLEDTANWVLVYEKASTLDDDVELVDGDLEKDIQVRRIISY
jgi:hypothetical protein